MDVRSAMKVPRYRWILWVATVAAGMVWRKLFCRSDMEGWHAHGFAWACRSGLLTGRPAALAGRVAQVL